MSEDFEETEIVYDNMMDVETTIDREIMPSEINPVAHLMKGSDMEFKHFVEPIDDRPNPVVRLMTDSEATIAELKKEIAELQKVIDSYDKPQQPICTKGEQAYRLRKGGMRWDGINIRVSGRALLLAKKYANTHGKEWPIKI